MRFWPGLFGDGGTAPSKLTVKINVLSLFDCNQEKQAPRPEDRTERGLRLGPGNGHAAGGWTDTHSLMLIAVRKRATGRTG